MQCLFDSQPRKQPDVSLILLDWCCRESFHIFDYLANQTIARDRFEVIWIEYYDRIVPEIAGRLQECQRLGQSPAVDQWIVMEMPRTAYYHKHLMYNLGIVASRGRILMIGDSDAMLKPTFVETIIESFERDPNIALHLDEVRNVSRLFYPFNYPSFEEVVGEGCINWKDGKTTGLLDKKDPIHTLNYGACFCALRDDLIQIGGADEHIDYLGHVCGPYELTWRLVNAGRREVWHEQEFLYHVWHPGTDGIDNYLGPHDGRNVSTTALKARRTGRILPLVENRAVRMLRLGEAAAREQLIGSIVGEQDLTHWAIDDTKRLMSEGRTAYSRSDYEGSIRCWEKVVGLLPPDSALLSDLGWSYYYRSRHDEALQSFDESLRLDPENSYALRGRAWTMYHRKEVEEAIADFGRALQYLDAADSDRVQETYRGRAWAYFYSNRLEQAVDDFRQALDRAGDNSQILQDLYRGLGWACQRLGQHQPAKTSFDRAIALIDPQNREIMEDAVRGRNLAFASMLEEGGKSRSDEPSQETLPQRAAGASAAGASHGPAIKSRLLGELGWAYYHEAVYTEALASFNQAITLDSSNGRALCGRGWTRLHMGRHREASDDFSQILERLTPGDRDGLQEAVRGRAWAHYYDGKFEEALRDFDQALNYTDGDNRFVLQNIYRGRSRAYYKAGMIERALEDATRARDRPASRVGLLLETRGAAIKRRLVTALRVK